jgi:hypothetical protein
MRKRAPESVRFLLCGWNCCTLTTLSWHVAKTRPAACVDDTFFGIIKPDFFKASWFSGSPVGNDKATGTALFRFVEMEICMNKKLLALAVAAVVSAPALADDSTVSLYGTLNVDFENVKAEGCTTIAPALSCVDLKQRNRVSSNSSNIGFRGVEPLMQGLMRGFRLNPALQSIPARLLNMGEPTRRRVERQYRDDPARPMDSPQVRRPS